MGREHTSLEEKSCHSDETRNMRFLLHLGVLLMCISSVHSNDACRETMFSDQVKNRSLKGHVIRVAMATDDLHCQMLCSIEGACSSFNLGPLKGGQHSCELSNSDHSQHPEEFKYREGFVYRYAALNLCGGVKCLYNASCQVVQEKKSPQCVCPLGYTGKYCNTDINECASNPCQNGGECTDAVNGYTCSCASGWAGEQCAKNINECASNPCQNGGTCNDAVNSYTCSCASGWEGVHCATDTNECASNPCQNGGACTDAVNGYTCSCASGWEGEQCTTDIDECASNPCQNGGACTDAVNGYTCSCASGWTGEQCTTDIDECASNPCQNGGTCTDHVNGYTCSCVRGWSGNQCGTEILWNFDMDLSGFVQDSNDIFDWTRKSGETSSHLTGPESDHRGGGSYMYIEASVPRAEGDNAKLIKMITLNGHSCLSFYYNMYGETMGSIKVTVDGTSIFSMSGNHGYQWKFFRTHLKGTGDKQLVFEGIRGSEYQGDAAIDDVHYFDCYDIDECASNPCQNGGMCSDDVNGYTCACANGWGGVHCTTDIDECASNPCKNGGTCTVALNDYNCVCTSEWVGKQCQKAIECVSPYSELSEANRNKSYRDNHVMCDSNIVTKWYRFTGSAGSKMATSCVPTHHCSTHAPGWLNGTHPTVAEGVVTRQVCYHWKFNDNDDCCMWSISIKVINCGEQFYIYKLSKPPVCNLRYCTE